MHMPMSNPTKHVWFFKTWTYLKATSQIVPIIVSNVHVFGVQIQSIWVSVWYTSFFYDFKISSLLLVGYRSGGISVTWRYHHIQIAQPYVLGVLILKSLSSVLLSATWMMNIIMKIFHGRKKNNNENFGLSLSLLSATKVGVDVW